MIPIYKIHMPQKKMWRAHDAIMSGQWSGASGEYVGKAIDILQMKFGFKHVLLTSSGTTANHLMVECLKHFHPEYRTVLVPNNVYVAAINPFLYTNYHGLYVLDTNLDTWNPNIGSPMLNEHNIFLAVHNLGNPIDVPYMKERFPHLLIVEDNCEGLGGLYHEQSTGTASIYSTLSFYANKNIGIGEGGAFVTSDQESYEYALKIHGQGQSTEKYIHDILGFNYRMTNIQAAMICDQLEEYDEIMSAKRKLFNYYWKNFEGHPSISLQKTLPQCIHSDWMFGIRIHQNPGYEYVRHFFGEVNEIETRPMFYPINRHKHLKNIAGQHGSNAETISRECFMLPSYPDILQDEVDKIVDTVFYYIKHIKKTGLINDK